MIDWRHTTSALLCAATVTLSSIGLDSSCGSADPNACDPPEMTLCSPAQPQPTTPQPAGVPVIGTKCPASEAGASVDGRTCETSMTAANPSQVGYWEQS